MGVQWFQFCISLATLISAAISILILFSKFQAYKGARSESGVNSKTTIQRHVYAANKTYPDELKWVAFIILGALLLTSIACLTSEDTQVQKPAYTRTPAMQSSPTPIVSSAPSISASLFTQYLCELNPIIENDDAFFTGSWNSFDDFVIGQNIIQHGIGIEIPKKDRFYYLKRSSDRRVEHIEFIEYSLGNNYDMLDFEFGIDQSTFELLGSGAPACLCKIVIQAVPYSGFASESENILFDSTWFNYRLSRHSANIDVSNVETMRITVFWEYDVDPTKDASLRIVLIDPKLKSSKQLSN
jgi:hypothetical protein